MSGSGRLTRRGVLRLGAALALAGCGGAGASAGTAARTGSTRDSTWGDPAGDGQLRVGPGEAMVARTELGRPAAATATLTTLAHLTDAHVLDASSPARVSFLDRLGSPFQSTFRPQEALTAQVLAGSAHAIRALGAGRLVQGGDLIDNDQANELAHAFAALRGGPVHPGSGRDGYFGVQSATNTDPFYYRPDVDAPRYPGLLARAATPFVARGVGTPVYPVLGDHDALVAGEIVPTALTRALATGNRALWDLPRGLSLPPGARPQGLISPDGPPDPGLVDELLRRALAGPTVAVAPDLARRELSFAEVQARLRSVAADAGAPLRPRRPDRLDYVIDAGAHVRLIVLDIVRRGGGSGGLIDPAQPAWVARELAAAGTRWVIVVSHQPLASSAGGEAVLALLDRAPRVIAALNGHTHRNQIRARHTAVGGYWLISTASLIDYPQQARALRVRATAGGGVALETWMLDHVFPGTLGTIARQLSYLDAEGGRAHGFAGARTDRNAILYRGPVI